MTVDAGWYPDPDAFPGQERWWDGFAWTEHVRFAEPDAPPVPQQPTYPANTYQDPYPQPVTHPTGSPFGAAPEWEYQSEQPATSTWGYQQPQPASPQWEYQQAGPADVLPGPAPAAWPTGTVLGAPPAARRPRWKRPAILTGLVAALLLLVGATAATAFAFLSGGGTQPEDVLPADTVAYSKIDLNPAIGQKAAAAQFVSNFSSSMPTFDGDDPIGSLLADNPEAAAEWAKIKPWLGDRYAAAVLPDDTPAPVFLIAVSDETAATEWAEAKKTETSGGFAYGFVDGYAVLAEKQATVDRVVTADTRLSGTAAWQADREALGGDRIAVAWADAGPLTDMIRSISGQTIPMTLADNTTGTPGTGADIPIAMTAEGPAPTIEMTGRVIFGLSFTPDSVVVDGYSRDFTVNGKNPFDGMNATTNDLTTLPADTLAAASYAGLGRYIESVLSADPSTQTLLDDAGISADDLVNGFDTVTLFALPNSNGNTSDPVVGVRLTGGDPAAAERVLTAAAGTTGQPLNTRIVGDTLWVALPTGSATLDDVITAASREGESLGDTSLYQQTVDSPATMAAFVNLAALVPIMDPTGQNPDLTKLGALSMTTVIEGEAGPGASSSRISLTLR